MTSKPHSKTVRGTLDNPKTQQAIKWNQSPPQLGDPTSLKPENGDKSLPSHDSAPPRGQGNDSEKDPGAPTVSDPYNKNEQTSSASDSSQKKDLPHSKTVRGTLANDDGKKVDRSQLGDPASLKAENSKTSLDRETEGGGPSQGTIGKSKL